jgi:FMN phosphatase YigB (HAD superfamily)
MDLIQKIQLIAMTKKNKFKKLLLIDVDGVLLDFNAFVKVHLAKAYGVKVPEDYVPSSWNMTDLAPKGMENITWESVVPDDWPAQLVPFSKARHFLNKMRKKGYHIVMVTRIGQKRQIHRIENLIEHNLHFDEIYFSAHGQSKRDIVATVLKRHKPNKWVFMDDKASTCAEVLELKHHNAKVYTLDFPFNSATKKQEIKDLIWLKTETELYERVLKDA